MSNKKDKNDILFKFIGLALFLISVPAAFSGSSLFARIDNFKRWEFDSPDKPGSGKKMRPSTVAMLDIARDIYGGPMVITSGYRTPEYNRSDKVGGVPFSAHTRGYAADIYVSDMNQAKKIAVALYKAGFRRFGISVDEGLIHVDNDPDKPAPAVWGYGGKKEDFNPANLI